MIPSACLLSHPVHLQLSDATVNRSVAGTANASYSVQSTGFVLNNGSTSEQWISSPSKAGNYDVLATLVSGVPPSGSARDTWLPLTSSYTWTETNAARDDSTNSCTLFIQIRERSSGTVKVTATVTLNATSRGTA